jgi:hypothetical protein
MIAIPTKIYEYIVSLEQDMVAKYNIKKQQLLFQFF